jgi:hypothetical protein
MKITSFDRTNLRALAADIDAALKTVADKYGISLKERGCSFMANNATFKIEGAVIGSDGNTMTAERQDFIRYAEMYDLKTTDLGRLFTFNGEGYTITGLKSRSNKAPILAKSEKNGKSYKFPVALVKAGLK